MVENKISLQVHLAFDDEAQVWYVAKSDIPGLSLEAESPTVLVERIVQAAPELLELNEGMLVNGIHARLDEPPLEMPELRRPSPKPRMTVLPIFDTPLELACAS